jgi:hypothetical protein
MCPGGDVDAERSKARVVGARPDERAAPGRREEVDQVQAEEARCTGDERGHSAARISGFPDGVRTRPGEYGVALRTGCK